MEDVKTDLGPRHRLGDGPPRLHSGHAERRTRNGDVRHARIRAREQHEEDDGQPDAEEAPDELGPELRDWRCAQEMAGFEVSDHVDGV